MRYIIDEPIITENTISLRAEVEGDPESTMTVTEIGIPAKDIEQKLIWNLQIIATKIARHKLGQITWK